MIWERREFRLPISNSPVLKYFRHSSYTSHSKFCSSPKSSVGFVQPEPESLIQMKFCTAESQADNLWHGGLARDDNHFGLASCQYPAWPVGRLWRVSATTRFD